MNIKELQNKLLASLGERLTAYGFGKKAKQQAFYRPIEDGWACVHLSFIDHAEDFDVTVDVAIRFNEVENLVNSKNNLLTKKEKEGTSTLGVELGNLSIGEQKRWSVSSEDQIISVTDSILNDFEMFGEPYLLEYSSMEAAYELLSGDDRSLWKHCPFHATRAKKVIALAKLLDKPDIEEQISAKKQFLESVGDFGLSDFVSFTSNLF